MSSILSHQPQERVSNQPQGGSSKLPVQASHQPGTKLPQTERSSGSVQPSQVKVIPNYHDEFKFGFPSSGLSSATHKWWETTTDEKHVVSNAQGEFTDKEEKEQQSSRLPTETSSHIAADEDADGKHGDPATSLASIRNQVAKEGRELLKLGVCKRCSPFELSKRERLVLSQVFQSSFPE